MAKPGNEASRSEGLEDMTIDASTVGGTIIGVACSSQGQGVTAPSRSRKKRRFKDEDEKELAKSYISEDENPLKKTRLGSPEPILAQDSKKEEKSFGAMYEASSTDDNEMEDEGAKKIFEEGSHEARSPPGAAAANVEKNSNLIMSGASRTPLPNLHVPSHHTHGKLSRDARCRPTTDSPSGEVSLPTSEVLLGSTSTRSSNNVAAGSESDATPCAFTGVPSSQRNEGTSNAAVNGTSTVGRDPISEAQQVQVPARKDPWARILVWTGFLFSVTLLHSFMVQSSMAPDSNPSFGVIEAADACLDRYKRIYYKHSPPPTVEILNQTRLQELQLMEHERKDHHQQKRQLLQEIKGVQKAMEQEIMAMQKNAADMKQIVERIGRRVKNQTYPVLSAYDVISLIDQILKNKTSNDLNEISKILPEIKRALGKAAENKVLDLSSLDLWEIPEMPLECALDEEEAVWVEVEGEDENGELAILLGDDKAHVVVSVIDQGRLPELSNNLKDLIDNTTEYMLEDGAIAEEIRHWIRSEIKKEVKWDKALATFTIEELEKQLVRKGKKAEGGRVGSSLRPNAILSQVDERLELEIADRKGRFDYASIRNGAVVIREGQRATSPSMVQHLPYFNRLLAHLGLRFYGYGAEAALTPTDPPHALGQCWAFIGEEATKKKRKSKTGPDFSRGSVATLTVRLVRPVSVHSVVIEHPPKELTDRMDSAIRAFRVIGYEDKFGSKGAFELGRFEYKPDVNKPMAEFEVARKLSQQEIPKLHWITLAIESTWGGSNDYSCLYRFRVLGEVRD